jgi:hypothetical protein
MACPISCYSAIFSIVANAGTAHIDFREKLCRMKKGGASRPAS